MYLYLETLLCTYFSKGNSVLQIAASKSTRIRTKCYIAKGAFVQFKAKSCIT